MSTPIPNYLQGTLPVPFETILNHRVYPNMRSVYCVVTGVYNHTEIDIVVLGFFLIYQALNKTKKHTLTKDSIYLGMYGHLKIHCTLSVLGKLLVTVPMIRSREVGWRNH